MRDERRLLLARQPNELRRTTWRTRPRRAARRAPTRRAQERQERRAGGSLRAARRPAPSTLPRTRFRRGAVRADDRIPPSSTAVDTPATCRRRSLSGMPARTRRRESSSRRSRAGTVSCEVVVAPMTTHGRERPRWPASPGSTNFERRVAWSFLTTRGIRPGCARTRTRWPRFATTRAAFRRCSARGGRPCAR